MVRQASLAGLNHPCQYNKCSLNTDIMRNWGLPKLIYPPLFKCGYIKHAWTSRTSTCLFQGQAPSSHLVGWKCPICPCTPTIIGRTVGASKIIYRPIVRWVPNLIIKTYNDWQVFEHIIQSLLNTCFFGVSFLYPHLIDTSLKYKYDLWKRSWMACMP